MKVDRNSCHACAADSFRSWIALIVLTALLDHLSACTETKDYTGFADSYHHLLFDSDNYDSYLATKHPQTNDFFFPCLKKHRNRHARAAQSSINACRDRCGNDSVCNFECNTQSGTEFMEARRDLLDLKRATLRENLDMDVLKFQGAIMGALDCEGINLIRALEGQPGLSCAEIAVQYRRDYLRSHRCTFERQFFESHWKLK